MSNYFFRPVLRDLTKGARLEFIRKFRYLDEKNVAEDLGLGGKDLARTIRDYERNAIKPLPGRLEELAELYEVSIDAIRDYDLSNPIDLIYIAMWQEELMPYFDINIDDNFNDMKERFLYFNITKNNQGKNVFYILVNNEHIAEIKYYDKKIKDPKDIKVIKRKKKLLNNIKSIDKEKGENEKKNTNEIGIKTNKKKILKKIMKKKKKKLV